VELEADFYADLNGHWAPIFCGRIEPPLPDCLDSFLVEAHSEPTLDANIARFSLGPNNHRENAGALILCLGALPLSIEGLASWCSAWPVVGKTVLERWVDRVRELGVEMVSVMDRAVSVPTRIQRLIS
jgi:hypothetical protein